MDYSDNQPGFWRRLGRSIVWILKTTLVSLLIIAVLVGLVAGGLLIFEELQRSYNIVTSRIDLLRSDVDRLMEEDPQQTDRLMSLQADVGDLQSDIDDLERQLSRIQDTVVTNVEEQQESLVALDEQIATVAHNGEQTGEEVTALENAIVVLQGDVIENGSRVDNLGGELDRLQSEMAALDSDLSTLRQTAVTVGERETELTETQRTLALFRAWGLIARARLRLVENNAGMAAQDVEQAQRIVEALMASPADEVGVESLTRVQARLELALTSLPGAPTVAARDLENAWDELDAIFVEQILPEQVEAETAATATGEATPEAILEVTPTPTSVVTPTATLQATPTPPLTTTPPEATPTPTVTPTPSS
jgi:peptidoglycan hydrolase CwlO-like protein